MEANFWHARWESNEIGFHEQEVNPWLLAHWIELQLKQGSRVFVPLCGKSKDIAWLRNQGYSVLGAELSEIAVVQLFEEMELQAQVTQAGTGKWFRADGIDIYVGDIFDLREEMIAAVDAVYDRAALVALPAEMRQKYAWHISKLTDFAPQLVVCFDYDQSAMPGPPFAVLAQDIESYYSSDYNIRRLTRAELAGGLKGKCRAFEEVWLLQGR